MKPASFLVRPFRFLLPLCAALPALLAGCGTPGAPLPPSLNLPERVGDLEAVRAGSTVTLQWTMPRRTTDKLLLKDTLSVFVCRQEANGPCLAAGPSREFAPAAPANWSDLLPTSLLAGSPRPLRYLVEIRSRAGRTAGPSNAAIVLAGAAPAPVTGLKAEIRKAGVALAWDPLPGADPVRLHRKLLTVVPKAKEGPLAAPPESIEQSLLVESAPQPGRALDRSIRFGQSYEYRAQRIARVTLAGRNYELPGEISSPVSLVASDIFPPAVPTALVAVATVESSSAPAVDLSWQPVDDPDLAGYAVYRCEGNEAWQRISPPDPVVGPAFRDSRAEPGHSYHYAVSAIAQNGHESQRSAEAAESVPER